MCSCIEGSRTSLPNLIQFCAVIPEVPQPLSHHTNRVHPSYGLLAFASCSLDFYDSSSFSFIHDKKNSTAAAAEPIKHVSRFFAIVTRKLHGVVLLLYNNNSISSSRESLGVVCTAVFHVYLLVHQRNINITTTTIMPHKNKHGRNDTATATVHSLHRLQRSMGGTIPTIDTSFAVLQLLQYFSSFLK